MVALRSRGARFLAPVGFACGLIAATPSGLGPQDLASLLARQPDVQARARAHMLATTAVAPRQASFFTLGRPQPPSLVASTLSFPAPVGTTIPDAPIVLAALDPRAGTFERTRPGLGANEPARPNRSRKADSLRLMPEGHWFAGETVEHIPDVDLEGRFAGISTDQPVSVLRVRQTPVDTGGVQPVKTVGNSLFQPDPAAHEITSGLLVRLSRFHFMIDPDVLPPDEFRPWAPGESPVLPSDPVEEEDEDLAPEDNRPRASAEGSPAERLGLTGLSRTKADRCLAEAIYYESRGEPVRGQQAVAQVIVNRAFSGFYPRDICGVVYQNAHRWMSCQFTFACDGSMRRGTADRPRWMLAQRIATDMLDGRVWLPEVGNATHYHATWVNPWWVRTMARIHRIGVHTFYRPRRWGTWEEEPEWRGGPIARQRVFQFSATIPANSHVHRVREAAVEVPSTAPQHHTGPDSAI